MSKLFVNRDTPVIDLDGPEPDEQPDEQPDMDLDDITEQGEQEVIDLEDPAQDLVRLRHIDELKPRGTVFGFVRQELKIILERQGQAVLEDSKKSSMLKKKLKEYQHVVLAADRKMLIDGDKSTWGPLLKSAKDSLQSEFDEAEEMLKNFPRREERRVFGAGIYHPRRERLVQATRDADRRRKLMADLKEHLDDGQEDARER